MKKREDKTKLENKGFSKNYVWLRMLSLFPEFLEEVKKIRKKYGVPFEGFASSEEANNWFNKKDYGFRLMWPKDIMYSKNNPFRDDIIELAEEFNLPFNFYYDCFSGVPGYITTNQFHITGKNWEIIQPILKNDKAGWIALAIFQKLTSQEIILAVKELNQKSRHILKENVLKEYRVKKQFDRDVEIFKHFYRGVNLVHKKEVSEGSLSELNRKSKNVVAPIVYKISPDALAHVIKRLDKLSIALFGKKLLKEKDIKLRS